EVQPDHHGGDPPAGDTDYGFAVHVSHPAGAWPAKSGDPGPEPEIRRPRPPRPGSRTRAHSASVPRLVAVAAAVPAAAPAGAGARLAGLGLVDRQRAPLEFGAVKRLDGGVAAVGHLHEAEAPATAGLAVGDDLRLLHGAVLAE